MIDTSAMGLIQVEEDVKILPPNIIITTFDKIINWGRLSSMWPTTFGLACCAIEMMAAGAAHNDLDRFGIIFRGSPRQADCSYCCRYRHKKDGPCRQKGL